MTKEEEKRADEAYRKYLFENKELKIWLAIKWANKIAWATFPKY